MKFSGVVGWSLVTIGWIVHCPVPTYKDLAGLQAFSLESTYSMVIDTSEVTSL